MFRLLLCCTLFMLSHLTLAQQATSNSGDEGRVSTPQPDVLLDNLDHPWGVAFSKQGLLITERAGKLRVARRTTRHGVLDWQLSSPVKGLPDIDVNGQGGLLDVATWKDWVYLSFSKPVGRRNTTAVIRGKLVGDFSSGYTLANIEAIFEQKPAYPSRIHFGSRLVFTPDDYLFITLGDRGYPRENAQRLDNHHGKQIRLHPDGRIPSDNPFVKRSNALPEIWSYGHRNMQGAALHPVSGKLWTHEHGPRGGDEINIPEPGKNYGWPVITYGEEYRGGKIGEGTQKNGMEQPLYYWVPSIAPSGMLFYTGGRYAGWDNSLLVGSLKFRQLVRLSLSQDEQSPRIQSEKRLYGYGQTPAIGERIRDIEQGPDGLIYLLTDQDNGKLWVLKPDDIPLKHSQ